VSGSGVMLQGSVYRVYTGALSVCDNKLVPLEKTFDCIDMFDSNIEAYGGGKSV